MIRGIFFLCLGFASALTLIYMSIEYEGLKDKLFSLLLCWTAKKKYNKKKYYGSKSKGNIYILKKKG